MMKQFLLASCLSVAWLGGALAAEKAPSLQVGVFQQELSRSFSEEDGLRSLDVLGVYSAPDGGVYAETSRGWNRWETHRWVASGALPAKDRPQADWEVLKNQAPGEIRQACPLPEGGWAVASSQGLFFIKEGKAERVKVSDGLGRHWGVEDVRGVGVDGKNRLWFVCLAGAACLEDGKWRFYTGREGLPYNDFTGVCAGAGNSIWFGTRMGLVRFSDGKWDYRQGKRWLPGDDVRGMVLDREGRLWVATEGGVGCLESRAMTLQEKAAFYEEEMERHIRRTEYGYVSQVGLGKPGDRREIHRHDDDNDGLWTAMYGAGECFAFAATRDPKAKDRAQRAFRALQFLQTVTQGTENSPPQGYVARTIRSVELPDPNLGRLEADRRSRETGDRMWKVYEPRWPQSADGKWYWKSDTSSDELDGHYFFYPAYYDLVAESAEEKAEVAAVVRDLTDHLIKHHYNLVDHDGTPTRWGVYQPDALDHHPDWWVERGLKSLSLLSYLAVAEHVTGERVYADHARKLIEDNAYDTNAMIYKIHRGPGSGNQSDDEMAFMSYYNLLKYTRDEALRRKILYSFYSAWVVEQPERNPFFHFSYAAMGLGGSHQDPFSITDLSPWDGWLEDSVETLKGFPLDRANWGSRNSHRLDIVLSFRQQTQDLNENEYGRYGYRVDGKVLPVENRHFNHYNHNPWQLDYSGDGRVLASGTVFLLPYYMGLYHGFIRE